MYHLFLVSLHYLNIRYTVEITFFLMWYWCFLSYWISNGNIVVALLLCVSVLGLVSRLLQHTEIEICLNFSDLSYRLDVSNVTLKTASSLVPTTSPVSPALVARIFAVKRVHTCLEIFFVSIGPRKLGVWSWPSTLNTSLVSRLVDSPIAVTNRWSNYSSHPYQSNTFKNNTILWCQIL